MKPRVLVASLVALALAAPAANALTIVNSEKSSITVKVLPKGAKEADLTIKAGGKANVDCKAGCELTLGTVKQQVGAKTATITWKSGKFVL